MDRRTLMLAGASLLVAGPAYAATRKYLLDRENSTVGFSYVLNNQRLKGRMPVTSASIDLDVDRPANSKVTAVIDASRADAGPFYATAAMKGEQVLDTRTFPTIRFESSRIQGTVRKAQIQGDLTIRDITRRVTLDATVFRQRDTEAGDRRKLSILMTGRIDRRAFGASGYRNLVAPEITLNILTRITLEGAS
ncbi:MAG: YceI family protein [Boseongicola sp.]|nr:YceI family protein [Boseongicola sp.]